MCGWWGCVWCGCVVCPPPHPRASFSITHPSLPHPTSACGLQMIRLCGLKRCTMEELWVKFCLRLNEDCSLGDSTSKSSERLIQSGNGGWSVYKILLKREFSAIKCLFYKRFFASHKELMSPWRGFSAFLGMRRCKDLDHEVSSWRYLIVWRSVTPGSLEHRVPHSPPWVLLSGAEGQQPQQHRGQSLQRQVAKALVVQLLADVLGKCQYVADTLV